MPEYRTRARSGTRLAGILAGAILALAPPAAAQVVARLQGGLVAGVVQDQDTGLPIRYALVLIPERDLRVFTAESGRFGVPGLGTGEYTLQVRQIGYAPVTLQLQVVREGFTPTPPPLVIGLQRQPLVLPEILVTATTCADPRRQVHDPAAQAILDQAITNGERILAMAGEFPLIAQFERLRAGLTASDSVLWFRWDTVTSQSEEGAGYRRGRVVVTRPLQPASIQYFNTSDIARKEFRENHCLWVRGEETIDSVRVVRIDFAPGDRVRTPDWEGTLFVHAETGLLWRSQASLTRIPRTLGGLRSASCEVTYTEIVPTLVHEKSADCRLTFAGDVEALRREVLRLLTWVFTGRTPGG